MRSIRRPPRSSSLVAVSNRLPYNLPRRSGGRPPTRNVGGLVSALEPILVRRGGCWIGWGGRAYSTASEVTEQLSRLQPYQTPSGVPLHAVPLSERDVSRYYHGFSNRALWPLFHGFPGKAVFKADDFEVYQHVNRRFAEVTRWRTADGGGVWVHDFHLMLLPRYLREAGFPGRIDFFLHIPFPPPEIFRVLPWRDELMDGLLAADRIGFHIDLYRDNFIAAARQICGATARRQERAVVLRRDGHEATVFAAPIGVDVESFERIAGLPEVQMRARRLREAHRGRRILLSTDRLDYTKGIRERLATIDSFLDTHPEHVGRVVFVQIVVPSRNRVEEYRVMKRAIDEDVGRINGRHARDGWAPIHYRYLALEREDLIAHYLAADVALVTPLRDGLNLVAAEYAASRVDDDGVLILSEFAGLAENAPGAIRVNPYDRNGCVRAVSLALGMTREERRRRMVRLREQVRANPVSEWAEACVGPSRAVAPIATAFRKETPRPRGPMP